MTLGLAITAPASAQEVTLKAVNAFQEGTYFAKNFERFIKKVNDEGKGVVQITYVGGPKAIPTFDQGAALRNGVVDLANTSASFTASLVPEGLALNYTQMSMAELRKNGGLDLLNKAYMDKGLYYFARTGENIPYHIYTNKKIDKADLNGLKLRIAPIYRDFFQKLGATVSTIPPGDVYTSLERGVVDGYGWPLLGIFDLGWQEKTKYRVDPGFYTIELGVVFSANSWKKLTPAQRTFLEKQGTWLESLNAEDAARDVPAELKKQEAAGIQVIKLDPTQSALLLKTASEAAWDGIVRTSPTHGQSLRNKMAPK
ncbi:TRAP transporter substrate-binding protein DctP [Hydrogenophaga sp.]|uniref:TRAP transporter substrate-binding protein DctP n=1 Tax=Hydrogenophaga sp. TaxID=1904254 RepID=UPI00286E3998|nr:TRAP transporter substrate-binding protein DctP [Hydrogenophaga sp.]